MVSVDGKGDGLSAMAGHATRTAPPSVDVVVPSAHSLGRLWWAASEYAGLPGHHAAGKTMALAGYGNPTYLPHFLRHWRVNSDSGFRMEPGNEHPDLFRQVPRLVDWMARREHVSAWFECDDDSPYMLRIVRARPERWGAIASAIHVDGTSRLHTVTRAHTPRLARLLDLLVERGHPPVLVNTSLNCPGEPIVHTVEQAFATARALGLDALVVAGVLHTPVGAA